MEIDYEDIMQTCGIFTITLHTKTWQQKNTAFIYHKFEVIIEIVNSQQFIQK
jgi:hypothetical protein